MPPQQSLERTQDPGPGACSHDLMAQNNSFLCQFYILSQKCHRTKLRWVTPFLKKNAPSCGPGSWSSVSSYGPPPRPRFSYWRASTSGSALPHEADRGLFDCDFSIIFILVAWQRHPAAPLPKKSERAYSDHETASRTCFMPSQSPRTDEYYDNASYYNFLHSA